MFPDATRFARPSAAFIIPAGAAVYITEHTESTKFLTIAIALLKKEDEKKDRYYYF